MPLRAYDCLESWQRLMPDWEYRLWNEDNFDVQSVPYTAEAYAAGKYAFVSDYVRLWALEREGGVYLDVDFEAYRCFEPLLVNSAFAGFEGSKHLPLMMGVCASEPHGEWVGEMLAAYDGRHFLKADGHPDMTTNVQFVSSLMAKNGFVQNGEEQDYRDLHIYPVEYFCPRLTTGEYLRGDNTYCESRGESSWAATGRSWKTLLLRCVGPQVRVKIIKLKRKILG